MGNARHSQARPDKESSAEKKLVQASPPFSNRIVVLARSQPPYYATEYFASFICLPTAVLLALRLYENRRFS